MLTRTKAIFTQTAANANVLNTDITVHKNKTSI